MSVFKFNYKNYGPYTYRPVIPIEIQNAHQSQKYEVLVDSGADICIFDGEIGELIGLNVASGQEHSVSGITGDSRKYYLHEVTIKVGGWPRKMQVGFMPAMPKFQGHYYGVVGQRGFFETFIVTFDLAKGLVELRQRIVK